ncbi:membrane-associating domain-containing protein [Podospora fimiseda]|uniref:Membrane-associating domain-containing protein n=1 Tax=Podospora fimiseda TaxID=252190 RepID=A0AAN7BFM3_9PEZI|nr:membrane-associating domain-containing protein [Podospora fimiseda]
MAVKPNQTTILLILRIFQSLFAVLVLALSSFVAHWYNTTTVVSSPSQINFLIFIAIFSILSVTSLVILPRVFSNRAVANPYILLGIEIKNVLFWFAGWVALAVFLSRLLFCRGSVCHAAQADVAFAAMAWICWAGSAGIAAVGVFKGVKKSSGNNVEVPSGGVKPEAVEKEAV